MRGLNIVMPLLSTRESSVYTKQGMNYPPQPWFLPGRRDRETLQLPCPRLRYSLRGVTAGRPSQNAVNAGFVPFSLSCWLQNSSLVSFPADVGLGYRISQVPFKTLRRCQQQ
ncbi:unnamed protein product [Ectocarpus sp. 12 AP-2014]